VIAIALADVNSHQGALAFETVHMPSSNCVVSAISDAGAPRFLGPAPSRTPSRSGRVLR
jgi:hypothetical protein